MVVARVRDPEDFYQGVEVQEGLSLLLWPRINVEQDLLDHARPVKRLRVLPVLGGLVCIEPEGSLNKIKGEIRKTL